MSKQRGFSLVEVLIALVLIGIVSAVSIRVLSNRDNTLEFTAKRDKVLANMQGITKERMFNLNRDEIDFTELNAALANLVTDNGGMRDKTSFSVTAGTGDYIASVKIDVNGDSTNPNTIGKDIFMYYVDRYGNFILDEISKGNLILAGGTSHWDELKPVAAGSKPITPDAGQKPSNGSLPESEDVYETCWDGSKIIKGQESCPPEIGDKECPDGTIVKADKPCPNPEPTLCSDGVTYVYDTAQCPSLCPDGTTWVQDLSSCPPPEDDDDEPTYKVCPDGSRVLESEACPETCVVKVCGEGYTFNSNLCACVGGMSSGSSSAPEVEEEPVDPYNWPISMSPLFYMDKNGFASVNLQSRSYDTGRFDSHYWADDIEVIRDPSTGTAKRILRLEEWLQIMGNPQITIQAVAKYDDGTEKVLPEGEYRGEYEGNGHVMLSKGKNFWDIWRDKDPANLMNLDSISIRVFADGKELTNIVSNIRYNGPTWGTCDEWKEGCEPEEQKYNALFDVIFPNDNDLGYGREYFYDEEDYFKNCADVVSENSYANYGSFTCTPTKVTKDFFKQ